MNKKQAVAVMNRHELDALVATTPENFVYLTDYLEGIAPRVNWYSRFFAVISATGDLPVGMLCPRMHLLYGAQAELPELDIRSYGSYHFQGEPKGPLSPEEEKLIHLRSLSSDEEDDPFVVLVSLLKDRGIGAGSVVGVDEAMLSHSDWSKLTQLMPEVRFVDAAETFREVRMIKTEEEVARLRRVLEGTTRAMQITIPYIQVGIPHHEVWSVLRRSMLEQGVEARHVCVGIGPSSSFAATLPSERRVQAGDLVKFDHSGKFRGYISDGGRTGVVGKPTDKQRHYHEATLAGQQAGCDAVKPGALARDIFLAMRDGVRSHGFPEYDRQSLGHGIGVEVYDRPLIAPGDDTVLEPGMVVNVEVPLYELGFGGFQIEDTLLVTETGHEYLIDLDKGLFVIE